MPVITCSLLAGQRFGNALFMYVFARAYAQALGCELQTPHWIGKEIFKNVNEPEISVRLAATDIDCETDKPVGYFFGNRDIDLRVYAQHQKYLDFYTRAQVREWLTLKPEFEDATPVPCGVGHLRLGDYLTEPTCSRYCSVSPLSYEAAAKKFGVSEPLLMVYEGWTNHGIGDMDWLADFLILRNARYLFRANSSFSWWAATLGSGRVFSPVVGDKVGRHDVDFEEGNWPCTAGRFRNQSDLHLKDA